MLTYFLLFVCVSHSSCVFDDLFSVFCSTWYSDFYLIESMFSLHKNSPYISTLHLSKHWEKSPAFSYLLCTARLLQTWITSDDSNHGLWGDVVINLPIMTKRSSNVRYNKHPRNSPHFSFMMIDIHFFTKCLASYRVKSKFFMTQETKGYQNPLWNICIISCS